MTFLIEFSIRHFIPNLCVKLLYGFALGMERVFELLKHVVFMRCFTSFRITKCFKASSESPARAAGVGNAQKNNVLVVETCITLAFDNKTKRYTLIKMFMF